MRGLVTCAVVAAVALVGCAGVDAQPAGEPDATVRATPSETPSAVPNRTPPVPDPKDARGLAACDLLTGDQLRELGVRPDTAEPVQRSELTRGCVWSTLEVGNPVGLTLADGLKLPALDVLYVFGEDDAVVAELVVAGHPALRSDARTDGTCTIYVALAEYQAVGIEANTAGRDRSDPCDLPRLMAEAILSNLPPLSEE